MTLSGEFPSSFFLVFLENSSLRALPESYLVENTSHVPKYAEWSEELICTAEGFFFFLLRRLLVAAQRIFTASYETLIVVQGLLMWRTGLVAP